MIRECMEKPMIKNHGTAEGGAAFAVSASRSVGSWRAGKYREHVQESLNCGNLLFRSAADKADFTRWNSGTKGDFREKSGVQFFLYGFRMTQAMPSPIFANSMSMSMVLTSRKEFSSIPPFFRAASICWRVMLASSGSIKVAFAFRVSVRFLLPSRIWRFSR